MQARSLGWGLALAGTLALSGCGVFGGDAPKLACPVSFIAPDTGKEAVFKPGGGTRIEDVSYGVELQSIESTCSRAERGIIVDTKLVFQLVAEDPALSTGSFQYFVSVVDGQRHILTKETYTMPFEFDPHKRAMTRRDELIETLPLNDASTGGHYAIVAGLQLTPAQLEFNRAGSRPPRNALPARVPSRRRDQP